jgi:cytochrome c-type biogenesis protein CcmE
MKKAYLIGIVIISIAAGFTLWAFSSAMSPYVDLKTARATGSAVQLRGIILRDPDHAAYYDTRQNALRFWIKDKNDERIEVVYHGAKPDAFDEASGTAAHGMIHKDVDGQEVFVSDSMVIQCPSKYSDSKSPYKQDGKSAGGTS